MCVCAWVHVCVSLTPSQLGWFCTDIQRFINSSNHNLKTHTHKQHHIQDTLTHLKLISPHLSQVSPNSIPSHADCAGKRKLWWKNVGLKMMYCWNCTESADESKSRIQTNGLRRRQVWNEVDDVKRLGGQNTTQDGWGATGIPGNTRRRGEA